MSKANCSCQKDSEPNETSLQETKQRPVRKARKEKKPKKPRSRTFELNRRYKLKYRYKITPEEYERLVRKQRCKCALCKRHQKILHIDHCHKTKKVRGLLCVTCNTALGKFQDDPKLLAAAIRYLKR